MRAYRITGGGKLAFAGTQTLASQAKGNLVESLGLKRKDVTIEEVEIPTSKPELISWINKLIDNVPDDHG